MAKNRQKTNTPPPKRGIPVAWLRGLPTEEAEAFEKTWRNSTFVLDKLKAILQRELEDLTIDFEDSYDNPSWTVLRADKNGQARTLKKIISLLP